MQTKLLIVASVLAVFLSVEAASRDYFVGDVFLARAIQEIRSAPWEEAMEIASAIGRWVPMAVTTSVFFGWFLWRRQKAEYVVLGAALLSLLVNPVLKLLVDRPRPSGDLVTIFRDSGGTGFPSGHAYTAMILLGLLYYLAPTTIPWKRVVTLLRIVSIMLILLIGISRVYLGDHWPSDVLGGFLVGGIVLTLLIQLHHQYSSQTKRPHAH